MRVLFDTPDEQWLFSREEVESFPSVQQDAPFAYELAYRVQAVTELFDIGNFFRLNWKYHYLVMVTAAKLLHRFYTQHSFQDYPSSDLVPACLFLAGKVEEPLKKAEAVAHDTLLHRLFQRSTHPDQAIASRGSPEHTKLQAKILELEGVILNAVQYDLHFEHPHPLIAHALEMMLPVPNPKRGRGHELNMPPSIRVSIDEVVRELAWDAADATFYLPICITHPPNVIAAAAIWLAFKKLGLDAQQQMTTAWEWISKLDSQRSQPETLPEMASQWWLHLLQTEWEPVEGVIRAVIALWSSNSELKKLPTFDVSELQPTKE